MGRRRKKAQNRRTEEESDYDSDDERAYKKMPVPDLSAQDFYMDEVDEFNEKRDKIPLERGMGGDSDSDEQEEVLPVDYSDSDDDDIIDERLRRLQTQQHLDEIASDVEEDEENEGDEAGLPDAKAWGKRKQEFYSTDYVDEDMPGGSGSEEEAAQEAEEKEALAIQKRMSQMMQDTDFDLQLFQVSSKAQEKSGADLGDDVEEKVVKDLSKLSKREKMEILKKESPEFLELVGDFKIRLKEVIDTLYPLLCMVKDGRIPQGPGADYVKTKFKLSMNYCVNISFYMTLKARHVSVHNHPVIGRILAHKKLLKELEPVDQKLESEIRGLLTTKPGSTNSVKNRSLGQPLPPAHSDSSDVEGSSDDDEGETPSRPEGKLQSTAPANSKEKSRKKSAEEVGITAGASGKMAKPSKKRLAATHQAESQEISEMTEDERKALEYYEKMAKEIQEKKLQKRKQLRDLKSPEQLTGDREEEEEMEEGKRAITYQISKNKGLTPHRKKEQRNPRVKHKMKFKKAKVRRKGQVREVRKELTRYGGELSGIRAGVIKSVKIK